MNMERLSEKYKAILHSAAVSVSSDHHLLCLGQEKPNELAAGDNMQQTKHRMRRKIDASQANFNLKQDFFILGI